MDKSIILHSYDYGLKELDVITKPEGTRIISVFDKCARFVSQGGKRISSYFSTFANEKLENRGFDLMEEHPDWVEIILNEKYEILFRKWYDTKEGMHFYETHPSIKNFPQLKSEDFNIYRVPLGKLVISQNGGLFYCMSHTVAIPLIMDFIGEAELAEPVETLSLVPGFVSLLDGYCCGLYNIEGKEFSPYGYDTIAKKMHPYVRNPLAGGIQLKHSYLETLLKEPRIQGITLSEMVGLKEKNEFKYTYVNNLKIISDNYAQPLDQSITSIMMVEDGRIIVIVKNHITEFLKSTLINLLQNTHHLKVDSVVRENIGVDSDEA